MSIRRCEDCKIVVDADARFCPKCGKEIGEEAVVDTRSRQIAELLASANVHRARQEWSAAIAQATRALELDPNNSEAAYIIGLIHEQRGDPKEAAVWYRLALDLNPTDPVIRSKLDHTAKSSAAFATRLLSKQPYILLGTVALLLVVVTALITYWVASPKKPTTKAETATTSTHRRTQIKTPATQTSAPTSLPTAATTSAPASSAPQPAAAPPLTRTAGESALKARLAETSTLRGTGAVIDDVIADPRTGTAIVTFSLLYSPTSGLSKAKVLQCSWQIARAACMVNTEVRNVTIRCVITPAGPATTQIAFVGEVSRGTVESLGENPTSTQLENAFRNAWWNPIVS
ncbi:MAG: tetratricopeptide repeat protein [Armatimonadota bacterium]|nr:tetratricopeptide repeat protein [Armatimonadota bacterium]